MAKTIKKCLNGWELNRVLSVTMDNASSNDVGIQHLKRLLLSQNGLVLNGEYLHTRCCAHILNLIVKDGMKEDDDFVVRIRAAVSTGVRILGAYRNSLTTASVEALICTEDWLKRVIPSFLSIEDLDNIDRIEDELYSTQDVGNCSAFVSVVDD
ncbi:hypothetical protein KIW84_042226 [Lathyrus oleraceus]|uniref:HAT C-terminal dimerisation domain-containing protein n=1 Tax=Pisum sativum TaxID=3888 RepID=A0A9D4XDU3_PEA|nr:hypothetical protein KIW84_042226 [Pisum sativum]